MKRLKQRFKLLQFINPRTGSVSWRVSGIKRDGVRIRENYCEASAAQARQVELEGEYFARETDLLLRATRLSTEEIRCAEIAFDKLERPEDLLSAVEHWRRHGSKRALAESPRLDDAISQFVTWLDGS